MNLFACYDDPIEAAQCLPDKHVCKMCIENAQMLAVAVGSLHGFGWGNIRKKDGSNYSGKAHFNHPSTKWIRESYANLAWAIAHGLALCDEFEHRYGKPHDSRVAHQDAERLFLENTPHTLDHAKFHSEFARAMAYPEIKEDESINSVEAYRKYLTLHKPWALWTKDETRKPTWWNPSLYEECQLQSTESHTKSTASLSFQSFTTASKKP